ncbi:hypothetical_protein [Leishmania major strain Friedlin]|nr:hypothetical_protein [Leishmania major strain Friedlin]
MTQREEGRHPLQMALLCRLRRRRHRGWHRPRQHRLRVREGTDWATRSQLPMVGHTRTHLWCSKAPPAGVSSSRRVTQRHLSDYPPPFQRTTVPSSRPNPRLRGSDEADVFSPQESQLLFRRLRRLYQWMGDLVTGVSAATLSGCADVNFRGDGGLRDPSSVAAEAIANVCPCSDSSATWSASPLSACESPLKRVTALRLHRVVDDLFMPFTQLQATLTDVVWCTSQPPALSTPVRMHLDHAMEVERQRRTLWGYEQSRQTAREEPAPQPYDEIRARRPAAPPLSSPPPPAGYAASNESGLFIALRGW